MKPIGPAKDMPIGSQVWPLGPATSMPNIWLFFPGYTWIDIVHDSEGSLIMYHGFVYEALLHDFTNIGSL